MTGSGRRPRRRGRTRRARQPAAARRERPGPPCAGTPRTARPARSGSARPDSQHSMSTKPAASRRRTVSSGEAKWTGPSQPSPRVARTRMTEAMLPALRTGRRAARRLAAPPRGSRTTRRDRRSSGRWPSRGSHRPVPSRGSGWPRSATTYSIRSPNPASRSRAAAIIAGDPSSAITRPRGRRVASSSVTRPVPHPASSTRSSPWSGSRSSTARPQRVCGSATRS